MRAALGVMTRAPVPGRCKTRLARSIGDARAAALAGAMLEDVLERVGTIPWARRGVFVAPGDGGLERVRARVPAGWELHQQSGDGLGARMHHALAELTTGGRAAVLVGTDSPAMDVGAVAAGLRWLVEPGRALMGPSDDGGYYLIGMSQLEPGLLRDIPWGTGAVAELTRSRCREHGVALKELPRGYDVDELADLERLRAELREHPDRAPKAAKLLERWG